MFDHADKKMLKMIKSCLKMKISTPVEDGEETRFITIMTKFKPKKEIKEIVHLQLSSSKEEGPVLSCNIMLNVTEGKSDSLISLDISAIKAVAF